MAYGTARYLQLSSTNWTRNIVPTPKIGTTASYRATCVQMAIWTAKGICQQAVDKLAYLYAFADGIPA